MKVAVLLCAVVLVGCAAPPKRVVKVDSEPPGVRVFFGVGPNEAFADGNKQYIGTTPCDYTPEQNRNGTFKLPGAFVYSTFVPPCAVFSATPPAGLTNATIKRVVYHGGTVATPPDKVPAGVFFDFTKP